MANSQAIFLTLAAGVGLSSAVIHFALGVRRPHSTHHLTFALLMLVTCPFQLTVARFASAPRWPEAAAQARLGVALAIILIVLFVAFVRQYSGSRIGGSYVWAHVAASAAWLLYDLASPLGLLYAGTGTTQKPAVAPIGIAWQVFNALTVLWGIAVGRQVLRHGQRRRGGILILGGSLILLAVVLDVLRNLFGWGLPYLGGFGIVGFSLLLSVELVVDFRESERHLTEWIAAAVVLRDQLNTPLQTLRFGLETLRAPAPEDHHRLDRLQRAVTRLSHISRDLQRRNRLS
jgi:hypothetical protein